MFANQEKVSVHVAVLCVSVSVSVTAVSETVGSVNVHNFFFHMTDYDEIFTKLKAMPGDAASKKSVVLEIIQEAKRLKKAQLIAQLEAFEAAL